MILSVWRYSHLALAISSFLLLIIASVTGIFLAFEPVIDKAKDYKVNEIDTVTLSQAIPALKEKLQGIQEITIDDNQFVIAKYSNEDAGDKQVYINPLTGKVLGNVEEKKPVFQWMTNLHRSLFLHETGRIIVGVASFLLILIAVSGVLLVVQRQNGWRNFFSTVEKTGFAQYYHVVFGRISLFFILAIAVTGTYLSIYRFVPPPPKAATKINEESIKEEPALALAQFPVFQKIKLKDVQKLQYPFSDFPEDYFTIQLSDREICVNQFTGEILAEQSYSIKHQLASFSLRWHTGRSGPVWAIIMAVASAYILFFIYSGFAITLKRRRARSKNKFKAKEAEIVILVGSENGGTFKFADAIYSQLIRHGKKAFITDLSNFENYPKAEQLLVMTSTYGQGDPPSNAKKFLERLSKFAPAHNIQYSVVGFGSRSYAHFCKFAYDVDEGLAANSRAKQLLPVATINDKSPQDFSDWLTQWGNLVGLLFTMPRNLLELDTKELKKVSVMSRTVPDAEQAFTIRLKSKGLKQAVSGDLLAIYPKNDHRERLYSIGKIDGAIQLSVKLHEHGLGSGFLIGLSEGNSFNARLIKNQHFRFPKKATRLILVSNGTGIAPFLGMITENKRNIPIQLFCGFRTKASFNLYEPFLKEQLAVGKLSDIQLTLSREGEREYVSHRLWSSRDAIVDGLNTGGVILICGSLKMQEDVFEVLQKIFETAEGNKFTDWLAANRILTDCY